MRWTLLSLAALLALATVWSCQSTPDTCVDYCARVGEALRRCDLLDDFDEDDCADRTVDVDANDCASKAADVDLASCDVLTADFCGEDTFACPSYCYSACCADSDCPGEQPHCDFGTCKECVTNDDCSTHSCYLGSCVECTQETQAQACPAGQACDYSNRCLDTCLTDVDCGDWRTCVSELCSDPVGTPCTDGSCATGSTCEQLDAANKMVPEYCTIFCIPGEGACPPGYTCKEGDGYCRP